MRDQHSSVTERRLASLCMMAKNRKSSSRDNLSYVEILYDF